MPIENKLPLELCNIVYQYSKDKDSHKYSETGLIFKKFMNSGIFDMSEDEIDEEFDGDILSASVRLSCDDFKLKWFFVYNYNYSLRRQTFCHYL